MASKRISFCAKALSAALLLSAIPALAQTIVSTLRGRVTDPQGAVVVGATVTARQIDTNLTRISHSDSLGQYLIANLPAGSYEVNVEQSGFNSEKQSNLVLRVGEESTVDLVLKVAGVQQSVTVTAEAAIVETQHTVGMNISTKQVDDLPTFNRSFSDLAQLSPGVNSTGSGSMGFSAAGQNQYQNNVFVDGGTNAMQFYGTMADTFPQDWIQEFQVMTNGFSAEFGHASGGVLNVITRSGGNAFHGRAYGFFQNASLNSPPYAGRFTNGQPLFLANTPPYRQYRVGGYLGGPVIKDKLFFFTGFENLDNSATGTLAVSQYWINQGVQSVIPEGYTLRPVLVKGDWNISDNNRLSIRHDRTNQELHNCSGQIGQGCDNQPLWTLESRGIYTGPIWSVVAALTSSFGNRAFNEARMYYGVNKVSIFSNLAGDKLGGAALLADTAHLGLYSEKTYPGAHFGSGSLGGLEGETNLYFTDNFSYIIGRHQLKFGGELSRPKMFMDIDASQHGRWNFSVDRVFNINDPSSYPFQYLITLGIPQDIEAHWNGAAYVQDTWKVRDNLTLNLGVRWEMDNTVTTGNQFVDGYNQRIISGYGGGPVVSKINPALHDISPRLGMVWLPTADHRTTVRISGGIFYDQNHFNYADILLNQTLLNRGRYLFNANNSSQNPFYDSTDPTGSAAKLRAYLASNFPNTPDLSKIGLLQQSANGIDRNFRTPYSMQLAVGGTHQFASNLYVQADYVTSHGRDMVINRQTNLQLVNGNFVTNDPRFSQITFYQNIGWTQYNAMQTRMQYNHGSRLQLGLSYTLARTTSNTLANGIGGGLATNPYNLSIDDGPSDQDRRHNLTFNGLYTLPHGIQLSGLFRYGSELPWTVTSVTFIYTRVEPRNSRRGHDYRDADVRLSKVFRIRERFTATVFWEVFNLFNYDNFYNYQGSLQSSSFGNPQSEFPKRAQQGGFRFEF